MYENFYIKSYQYKYSCFLRVLNVIKYFLKNGLPDHFRFQWILNQFSDHLNKLYWLSYMSHSYINFGAVSYLYYPEECIAVCLAGFIRTKCQGNIVCVECPDY